MSQDKYLNYLGDVKAAAGVGGTVLLVTTHPENRATALYRIDAEKFNLAADALPCGGLSLVTDGEVVYVGGTDGKVYAGKVGGGNLKPLGATLPAPAIALALLSDNRLAALHGNNVAVLSRKDGKPLQTLELPEAGTAIASDPTGKWLVAGTGKGNVLVFECEEKAEFVLSEQDRLHEGAVSALLFEPEELRFYSAGADQKLLSTHARGKLEPEDRGKGQNHTDLVTAIIHLHGDRFATGSRDSSVKSWPRARGGRPVTLKDGVGAVVGLAAVKVHNRRLLAIACDDNTLRVFQLDDEGRFGEQTHKVFGAADWAKYELGQPEPRRREAALKALAEVADTASVELIAKQMKQDGDHQLRLLACKLLAESKHPRAGKLIENGIRHNDEAVRLAALEGTRRHMGMDNLRPLSLALKVEKADVGRVAVLALQELAAKDDQALTRLTGALDVEPIEVRQAALTSLEKVYPADSPDADLTALNSKFADLRRLALVRTYQREMLTHPTVQAAMRWRSEDADPEVRKTAFLLSLYTRPKLIAALRERDPELERQLFELENYAREQAGQKPKEEKKPKEETAPAKGRRGAVKAKPADLGEGDHDPLLQATASRSLDTCLRGARGLALLGDPRAFGLLLQLSREDSAAARVEVCRAMAALDDERAVNRLRSMLYDADAAVRDAAFSALVEIHDEAPLVAAESGLNAAYEDVRRRGLQVLVSHVKARPPKTVDEPGWQLMVRALNDSAPGVRSEAFKSALNLQIGGGGVQTMRFVLQSVHADVRREVLTEMMARSGETWAWDLLLEFYNDPDPKLREEAFEFATKKVKEIGPLERGLQSHYPDVRKRAVDGLIKKRSKEAQALLVRALADNEKEVRLLALDSLVHSDAREPLTQALLNAHADVRVRAATALARHGAKSALAPLLALATAPEPPEKERVADWLASAEAALGGLAQLGDPEALSPIVPLLDSKHPSLRVGAAKALVWVSPLNAPEGLKRGLQSSDENVKYRCALGLALAGEASAAPLVFSDAGRRVLSKAEQLAAALCLGPIGEDLLVAFLDDPDESVRNQALMVQMLLELAANRGTPTRCLACLSAKAPRGRLTAAQALECFADPAALKAFVVKLFNDRGEDTPWKVKDDVIEDAATLLAFGKPHTRARTALLLQHLSEKEQAGWNQGWTVHADRFAGELAEIKGKAKPPAVSALTPADLRQLAFGAYVGLVREQGEGGTTPLPQVIRVRQTALTRLQTLATSSAELARAVTPVLVQALGDPNQPVRTQAFDQLLALGMDRTTLGAEAVESGHTDLGVKGMELLSGGAGNKEGQRVLENIMLTRKDDLTLEAAKLLKAVRGEVPVAIKALEATHEAMRQRAVEWLAAAYDKDPSAKKALQQALASRYQRVRSSVALELSQKKDPAAFDALVKLLDTDQEGPQRRAIQALVTLGDARAADAFLDRLENDPASTALGNELLQAAGNFRNPMIADRLLRLVEKNPKFREAAFQAAVTVSGFDQSIDDFEGDNPDTRWLKEQHPRNDAVLAKLLELCFNLGETGLISRLMESAKWAQGKEVDPVLALLTTHTDEDLRHAAVEALGWRLKKRKGSAEPLLKSVQHKDHVTQFLAAEGLARAGRAEGLSVLMSAVEFATDLEHRSRAVVALGLLGDTRALDLLMKLATEDGHVLQEEATEALGHMGRSPRADDVFQLLERYIREEGSLPWAALRGLRWLNTAAAWGIIRRCAADETCGEQCEAVKLLGHNDDPATRDVLLKLLTSSEDYAAIESALFSGRRLWGADSLEPDYAVLQNAYEIPDEDDPGGPVARVCNKGDAKRMLEILPRVANDAVQEKLGTSLMNRVPAPLAEAEACLTSNNERTVQVAAHLLGRAGSQAAKAGPAIEASINKWRAVWDERRRKMARENRSDDQFTGALTACLQSLLWTAGRLGVARDAAVVALAAHPDDPLYRPIRLSAVAALVEAPKSDRIADALEKAATGNDAEVRTQAIEALAKVDPARANKLATKVLSDRVSFNRMAARPGVDVGNVVRDAAGQLHYQGVALPHLLARRDLASLASVAGNRSLPLNVRLGAVEGLGRLADETAEERLKAIGATKDDEKELRKAAWRALRRSKRARKKAATTEAKV